MKKVLVYGIGGIGGYIGAKLGAIAASEKIELGFIARGAHLEAIKTKGLRYRAPDGKESTVHPALALSAPSGKADCIFLCVKGYDLDAACEALLPAVHADTLIVPLLNGADIHE